MVEHNHELDYVCPQCGADQAGADAHAEVSHTWPPGKPKRCPACHGMPAMVRKVQKDPGEPFVPEIDLFPWHAWCPECPWKTTTGAWRDAFDLAFYHVEGGKHIEPEDLSVIVPTVAIPTVVLRDQAHGKGASPGNPPGSSGNPVPSIPTGSFLREDQLVEDDEPEPYEDITGIWGC